MTRGGHLHSGLAVVVAGLAAFACCAVISCASILGIDTGVPNEADASIYAAPITEGGGDGMSTPDANVGVLAVEANTSETMPPGADGSGDGGGSNVEPNDAGVIEAADSLDSSNDEGPSAGEPAADAAADALASVDSATPTGTEAGSDTAPPGEAAGAEDSPPDDGPSAEGDLAADGQPEPDVGTPSDAGPPGLEGGE